MKGKNLIGISKKICTCAVAFSCLSNAASASAAEVPPIQNNVDIVSEGYTEEGIRYTAYQNKTVDTGIMPCLMDHQKVSCTVNFDGNIVPPSTWYFVTPMNATTYKGTLHLTGYYFDNFFGHKTTIAFYSGTVYGTL